MSVTFEFPVYRLAKQLKAVGGITVAQAITQAQAGLNTLSPSAKAQVDDIMDALEKIRAALPPEAAGPVLKPVYDLSAQMIGRCHLAGLAAMGRAAYGFCDLLDAMMSGRADDKALGVHIQALQLLRRPESLGDSVVVEKMLEGLAQVRQKYSLSGG